MSKSKSETLLQVIENVLWRHGCSLGPRTEIMRELRPVIRMAVNSKLPADWYKLRLAGFIKLPDST